MDKELIYVGDPMCSWCYGFSSIKEKLTKQCEGRVGVKIVLGGLRPYNKERWDSSYRAFLRQHWKDIGERSGQHFGFKMLENHDFIYDTEPSCRAVVTAREIVGKDKALHFFSDVQRAFYCDNKDITDDEVLFSLAIEFGLEIDTFKELYISETMKQKTSLDFEYARRLGVQGFPTVILRDGRDYTYLTVGYQEYEKLQANVEKWITAV